MRRKQPALPQSLIATCPVPLVTGNVTRVNDLWVQAHLPGARIGMQTLISTPQGSPTPAEVIGCDTTGARLVPFDDKATISPGDRVQITHTARLIPCGEGLLGRIIDPFGNTMDDGPSPQNVAPWEAGRNAPNPLVRLPVCQQLVTGTRVVDGLAAIGKGQRMGLFAGPGQGKSTLLGSIARRSAAQVCIICLVGERGREVGEFVRDILGPQGLDRSVVIVATADAPILSRVKAVETATAVAEWFREKEFDVLLLVDSLTRVVRARRDLALALGEPPARQGFPASSFLPLASLLERAGPDAKGTITGIYAVLTEEGSDDPVAQEARSLLDGHIVLSPKLAAAAHWPAVDVGASVSRVMKSVVCAEHAAAADRLRRMIAAHARNEDLLLMGAYKTGSCPDTDLYLRRQTEILNFLRQSGENEALTDTVEALRKLTSAG